ncbi:MAG: penicillin-binding protein 1C [Candidatus Sumerlaeota bacterium]|nr:penicillin-binding protein 1C [Candidatus Sumerlaeota bacterium]
MGARFQNLTKALWRRRRRVALGAAAGFCLLAATIFFWPMNVESILRADASGQMMDRSGALLYAFLNDEQQWCFPRRLDEISPYLIKATIAAEDQRFYSHPGVDPLSVARAAWQDLKGRRIVSGASTITMQVVKAWRGAPSRSLWRKLCQAIQAVRLDWRAPKADILEAYLNKAPYGLNLVGCEAAARRYFGKPAAELTLAEAALVAGLPKAPGALEPLKHPEAAKRRRDHVLQRMREEGFISPEECERAVSEKLGARWTAFPALSPHLAMRLKPLVVAHDRTYTTLDRGIQSMAERLAREHLARFAGQFDSVAVVVADAPSASLLAHVGSADFFHGEAGQVDATRAARSPGSTLKPFTYALAMERGRLYACETLLDAPLDYGRYEPENFDRRYHGLLSAGEALRRSLNVPAIVVLERVGIEPMYQFLRGVGLTSLTRPATHYGLGLTLGSCEARLEDLAGAYAMLANLGQCRPLAVLRDGERPAARPLLERGTCLELYDMLEQPLPEELDRTDVTAVGAPTRAAYKTGTSTGQRDAWAFVFNRQHVVGVWAGNNDARPSPSLVGARAALPLAARLFRSLPVRNDPAWPGAEDDLHAVRVCAVSGLPASLWCATTKEALLPRSQFLNRVCEVHRPSRPLLSTMSPLSAMSSVSPLSTKSTPSTTSTPPAPPPPAAAEVIECWPARARQWDLANVPVEAAQQMSQPMAQQVPRQTALALRGPQRALSILEPGDKTLFVLTGEPHGDRVKLQTSLDSRASVYWYLDGLCLGASQPQSPLFLDLEQGKHTLACMTLDGATDRVEYEVTR